MPAGVGGVLVFQHDGCRIVRAFGVSVPAVLLEEWVGAGKRHLIGQVEMYDFFLQGRTGLAFWMVTEPSSS